METELKARGQNPTALWFQAVLVPKGTDLSKTSRLSELQKQGGKIIAPGLF
jgi:hypothetical protein